MYLWKNCQVHLNQKCFCFQFCLSTTSLKAVFSPWTHASSRSLTNERVCARSESYGASLGCVRLILANKSVGCVSRLLSSHCCGTWRDSCLHSGPNSLGVSGSNRPQRFCVTPASTALRIDEWLLHDKHQYQWEKRIVRVHCHLASANRKRIQLSSKRNTQTDNWTGLSNVFTLIYMSTVRAL